MCRLSEAAEVEDAVARGATVARRRSVVHTSVAEKRRLECMANNHLAIFWDYRYLHALWYLRVPDTNPVLEI